MSFHVLTPFQNSRNANYSTFLRELKVVNVELIQYRSVYHKYNLSFWYLFFFPKNPTTRNSRKLQRHKNFDQVVDWVSDEFEQYDQLHMTFFKEKYVEVYGSPAKNWQKVFWRVRGRLNLEAKSIVETYVGKPNTVCKPSK